MGRKDTYIVVYSKSISANKVRADAAIEAVARHGSEGTNSALDWLPSMSKSNSPIQSLQYPKLISQSELFLMLLLQVDPVRSFSCLSLQKRHSPAQQNSAQIHSGQGLHLGNAAAFTQLIVAETPQQLLIFMFTLPFPHLRRLLHPQGTLGSPCQES